MNAKQTAHNAERAKNRSEWEIEATRLQNELDRKQVELDEEVTLLKKANLVEKERLKERERTNMDLMEKLASIERDLVAKEADLIGAKSQYEDLKRQLVLNGKELGHQVEIEQKLRRDLNRNMNGDLELKKERDSMAGQLDMIQSTFSDKDDKINRLENALKKYEDKSLRLARTVDKLRGEKDGGKPSDKKQSVQSYYPFPNSSAKKGRSSQEPSPLKSNTNNSNPPLYYSNMPNYYSKYNPNNR